MRQGPDGWLYLLTDSADGKHRAAGALGTAKLPRAPAPQHPARWNRVRVAVTHAMDCGREDQLDDADVGHVALTTVTLSGNSHRRSANPGAARADPADHRAQQSQAPLVHYRTYRRGRRRLRVEQRLPPEIGVRIGHFAAGTTAGDLDQARHLCRQQGDVRVGRASAKPGVCMDACRPDAQARGLRGNHRDPSLAQGSGHDDPSRPHGRAHAARRAGRPARGFDRIDREFRLRESTFSRPSRHRWWPSAKSMQRPNW